MKWTTWQLAIVLAFIAVMTLAPMYLLATSVGEDEVLKTGAGAIFAAVAFAISYTVKAVFGEKSK